MDTKIYIFNGKQVDFPDGGSKIKLSSPISELKKLIEHQEAMGEDWIKIDICKRKQPSEKGMTHYGLLDTWKPNNDVQGTKAPDIDDVPF
jgi:hypothetical protein